LIDSLGNPCAIRNSDVIMCDLRTPYIIVIRQPDKGGDEPLGWSDDRQEAESCFRPAFLKDQETFESFVNCLAATHNMKAVKEAGVEGPIFAYRLISRAQ
jgi:hypothetical protein